MPSQTIVCACGCEREGPAHARLMLKNCYDRLNRKKIHTRFPRERGELVPRPMRLLSQHITERVEQCGHMLAQGLHKEEIAIQLGMSYRTVCRYAAHLQYIEENTMGKKPNDHLADDLATSTDKKKNEEIVRQAIEDSKADDAETDKKMGK